MTLYYQEVPGEDKKPPYFTFDSLVVHKLKEPLPEPVEVSVIKKVTEREFEDSDFKFPMECQQPTEEMDEYFQQVYEQIKKWLAGLL